MQAGARRYPEPPLPRQHEAKPGAEHAIEPAPMYDAPYYRERVGRAVGAMVDHLGKAEAAILAA